MPDCRVDPAGSARAIASAAGGRSGVPAGHEQPLDPGREGGLDDGRPVRVERVGLEMGVAVDQAHRQPGPSLARRRGRGLGLEAREERLGGAEAAGLGSVGAPAQLVEERRAAVAVGAVARIRSRAGPATRGAAAA